MSCRFQCHGVLLLAALLATGLVACGGTGSPEGTGSPSPRALAELRAQANEMLDGGPTAFRRRLGELRGHPVVVNQWASWCGPCRFEFPFFRQLAKKYDGRIAFLGVDSQDSRTDAQAFLNKLPVPYPHYFDPDASIARIFRGGQAWPTTAFYDRSGKLTFTHPGAYATQAKLDEDIRTYARG